MDVPHVEFILEVAASRRAALLRQEETPLLLLVVGDVQLNGILQRIGIRLCHVASEVPRDSLQNIQKSNVHIFVVFVLFPAIYYGLG